MAGRRRSQNRGTKRKANDEPPQMDPSGVVVAEDVASGVVAPSDHAARSVMMTAPLGTLMRIEATIWRDAKNTATMSLDYFYALARAHEWLGLGLNREAAASNGETDDTKMTPTMVPKQVAGVIHDVYELISQLSEEQRLLFDLLVISAWDSKKATNIYPLYCLRQAPGGRGKVQLEVLLKPALGAASATTKSNVNSPLRSEVLVYGYRCSRKYFSFDSTVGIKALHSWWEHSKSVAQMIHDHRGSMAASISKVKLNSCAEKPPESSVLNNTFSSVAASASKNIGEASPKHDAEKNMTLEERVRARSLRNRPKSASKSLTAGKSPQENEKKSLLSLADALWSYSQRRGLDSSRGGGGTALERLRNRSAGGDAATHATKSIVRLPVADLMKDARTTWSAVVNESVDRRAKIGGGQYARGGATRMVNVDLGRVLFQLRLQMVSVADVSDRRQMEVHLLGLLEKLANKAPSWIHLRKAPSTLTGAAGPKKKKIGDAKGSAGDSTNQREAATMSHKLNIHRSIIVIRNDSVDYATQMRATLGGRVHNSVELAVENNGGENKASPKGRKRSFRETEKQRHAIAADAIVPPSFRRIYGKALGLDEMSRK